MMMRNLFRSALSVLFTTALSAAAMAQQNGMYPDHQNNYLIPLQSRDALAGHAYVLKADELSRDSGMYVIGVYDQFLVNVGERKLNMSRDFEFDCAAFDGKEIYTRFSKPGEAVRYIVFDQQAGIVFDTTLRIRCKTAPEKNLSYYRQTSIFPLGGEGIIDNIFLKGKGAASATVRISSRGPVWVNDLHKGSGTDSRILYADRQRVVQAVYHYSHGGQSPVVSKTSVVTLDAASGQQLGEAVLSTQKDKMIFPVNAAVQNGAVEVVAAFTRLPRKYARVKYGVGLFRLDASGNAIQNSVFNEFTTSLLKDTVIKGRQVMTNSYLYISHAARMHNGHWLLAMQQFSKLPIRARLMRNKEVDYQLKTICFAELNETAAVVSSHMEENDRNRVTVPGRLFRNPQNSGIFLAANSVTDVGYFVAPDESNERVSFVFTDINSVGDLEVGNVSFCDGVYKVDRFTHSEAGSYGYAKLLPARYGHTYLISFRTGTGRFELDNIKFNN